MARTDIHLDAMLRHLGAAYYESLHGRATRADVTRALSTVEEHLGEVGHHPGPGRPAGARHPAHEHGAGQRGERLQHPQGWSRRVRDVMTTSVVTVDRITPYKEIARLLAEHRVSGLPVLRMGRHVVGVVSRRDLLSVFLRPDEDIAADIRRVLGDILLTGPDDTDVKVRNGVVTLAGSLQPAADDHTELIPLAIKLMWDVDGVVDVVDQHGAQHPAAAGEEQEVEPVEH